MPAAALENEPAQHRNIVVPGNGVAATGAGRALADQAGRAGILVNPAFQLQQLAALAAPLVHQARRKAQNNDIQKASSQKAQNENGGPEDRRVKSCQCRNHYITAAILNMGRYMPTTMLPTMPPMNTMMMGSSRLERASTVLFTSSSYTPATLLSI